QKATSVRDTLYVVLMPGTAFTYIYTLSLHDALPIFPQPQHAVPDRRGGARAADPRRLRGRHRAARGRGGAAPQRADREPRRAGRSEEHTSELQSRENLVCRLLLEKKKRHG